jgi:hypothetical protein
MKYDDVRPVPYRALEVGNSQERVKKTKKLEKALRESEEGHVDKSKPRCPMKRAPMKRAPDKAGKSGNARASIPFSGEEIKKDFWAFISAHSNSRATGAQIQRDRLRCLK